MSAAGKVIPFRDEDKVQTAKDGTIVTITPEGDVYFDAPSPAVHRAPQDDDKFDQNLAESIPDGALGQLISDYLDGVNSDILSRSEFVQNYNNGVDLLPLKLEVAASVRGNRTSISRAKNPGLLRACMRSQSLARAQLLPASGPAKVQTISGDTDQSEEMARNFQQDLNYFLTDVDQGFYDDTDRMLFYRAFGGSAYKKVYYDPLLRRPTSRFVSLDSLIVSEDATSLTGALRKTNELVYNPVEIKRMQAKGGWLDVDLGSPQQNVSPARRKILESQGLSSASTRMQDTSFTIYEGYTSFCPEDYGWDDRQAEQGMPAPYRLVFDRDSRKPLALHRNWKKGDPLFRERDVYVKYGLVPGLGFLDYGFLHLVGNQVRVLTAIWQIMIDKGMLANFPSGMKIKGVRTPTNEINPGLGEWVEVDVPGNIKSLKDAIMGMPYGDISQNFMTLAEMLEKDVAQTAGTLEIPTGTGTTNTPVGTILAIIEQQAQDLSSVQQRDHRAQRTELRLLRDLFVEHPESLRCLSRPGSNRNWQEMVEEFSDMDLVPASDPNVPSQAHRILINQFLLQLAEKAPQLFGAKLLNVAERILTSIGINDAKDLLISPQEAQAQAAQMSNAGGGRANPGAIKAQLEAPIEMAKVQNDRARLALEQQENQREAANEAQDGQIRAEKHQADMATAQAKEQREERALALEEAKNTAGDLPAAEAAANLENIKARTFAAVGSGAMAFAKAGQSAAQGERDTRAVESDQTPPESAPPPQQQQSGTATLSGSAAAAKTSRRRGNAKPAKGK